MDVRRRHWQTYDQTTFNTGWNEWRLLEAGTQFLMVCPAWSDKLGCICHSARHIYCQCHHILPPVPSQPSCQWECLYNNIDSRRYNMHGWMYLEKIVLKQEPPLAWLFRRWCIQCVHYTGSSVPFSFSYHTHRGIYPPLFKARWNSLAKRLISAPDKYGTLWHCPHFLHDSV